MVEGFKHTEVGVIPNDWNTPCIKQFTDILSGGTPSTKMPEYWGGEIRWMNSGELNLKRVYEVEGRITELGLKSSATKLIPSKCVLVGLAGQGKTRGTVAVNYVPLCTNQSIAAILPARDIDEDFLYHNLDLRYKELRSLSTGDGGRGGLNLTLLRNLAVPLPPTKAEQTAIATALNDADALIQKLEQLLTKKRNIKTGAMQELLKPKEGWEEKTLHELADNKKELFDDGDWIEAEHITNSGIRLIQTGNIGIGCYVEKENKKYIFEDSFYKLRCKQLIEGDLLICRLAEPAGRACVLPNIGESRIVTSVDVTIFRPRTEFANRIFLSNMFSTSEWFSKVIERVGGTTHKRISRSALGKITISLPKIEEQNQIAQILSDMDNEIQELERQLEKYKMMKQGMMQSLLTGKIRLV